MAIKKFIPPDVSLMKYDMKISDVEFDLINKLIYQEIGIKLGSEKKLMVQSRLAKRLRQLEFYSYQDYLDYLNNDGGNQELSEFINSITTNKTDFFREIDHFNFLKRTYLQKISDSKQKDMTKTYYVWSAACSSGEEVYTLAMLFDEFRETNSYFQYKILGTDIDTNVLEKANNGIYSKNNMHGMPPQYLHKYFLRGKSNNDGKYRFNSKFKNNIKFRQSNLIDPNEIIPISFDIIFLRNVLIYFDKATIQKVIDKLVLKLNPEGYLFIGHSETLSGIKHNLKNIGNAIYLKKE